MDHYQHLRISTPTRHVALATLHRPEAANALNTAMALEISDYFSSLARNIGEIRVVILVGSGEKVFCAGADLKERKGMDRAAWSTQHDALEAAMRAVVHCPLPVIAAVNGAAYGGGCELALACDFIYAAESARFALPEATLGIMPGMGGTQQLPRAVGMRRARELILSGTPFSADQAYAWGMVNEVCTAQDLITKTLDTARIIAANAPLSVRAIRSSLREGAHLPLEDAFACELHYYDTLLDSRDRQEGIDAFNEKRPPEFVGR